MAPDESNVDTEVSPVTSNVESKVTASSTFNVPFTVVITPEEATLTTPPPVASDVAPDEDKVVNAPVDAEVAPIVVPSIAPPFISAEELIPSIWDWMFDVTPST